jgi:phospholipase C
MLDYDGLGFRIPMLIVSAYAKNGYVDHTHFEHGSILRFVEQRFGLAALSKSDARATAPDDAFDFTKPPRPYQTIPSAHDAEFFKRQPPDHRDPDPG